MIDVHAGLAFEVRRFPRLAAVLADVEIRVDRPDPVGAIRIDEDFLVVGGAAAAKPVRARLRCGRLDITRLGLRLAFVIGFRRRGLVRAAPAACRRRRDLADARPGITGIVGAVEALLINRRDDRSRRRRTRAAARANTTAARHLGADQRVHARRVLRIDPERDTTDVVFWQAVLQLRPRLAGVLRLPDASLGTAADHLPHAAAPLVRRRVDDVGVLWIEDDVADAGVVADVQHLRPGRAGVGRLVEAALAARRPERPLCGDVDDVRVARVDEDLAEVLGFLQPHPLPRLAGVGRLVDAVAEVRAALAGVFTGPEPHHVRVLRIDDDAAERERAAAVENRREARAAVRRLPQSAERAGHVPGIGALRIDGDVLNAAGLNRRADAAELETLEHVGGRSLCGRGLSARGRPRTHVDRRNDCKHGDGRRQRFEVHRPRFC